MQIVCTIIACTFQTKCFKHSFVRVIIVLSMILQCIFMDAGLRYNLLCSMCFELALLCIALEFECQPFLSRYIKKELRQRMM